MKLLPNIELFLCFCLCSSFLLSCDFLTKASTETPMMTEQSTIPFSPTTASLATSTRPKTITTQMTPSALSSPMHSDSLVVLFARDDDLWRSDVLGKYVERLTENKILNWRMDEGDEWRLEALSRPPQVSPDGQWIAVSSTGQEITLIDIDQQVETRLLKPGALLVAWSPNSQHLAYTSDYKSLSIYDVQEDKMIRFLENDGVSDIGNFVWSPDSRIIAFSCCFVWGTTPDSSANTGQIQTFDVFTNQMTVVGETWVSIGGGSPELCWTADGQVALIENTDQTVNCSYTPLSYKALSPDGQRQASLKNALPDDNYWTGPSLLTVQNSAGDLLWERQLEENVRLLTWSPDSQYILLDDDFQNHSPIWRIRGDGTSELEIVVQDGFLVNIIPAWQ